MFDTLSTAQLEKLLDQFSVPMSIIERTNRKDDFRIRGMNRAFSELSGLPREDVIGRSIIEFAEAAQDALESYRRCVATRQTIRFSFVFSREQQRSRWDKTLQYCAGPEGVDRVIATALRVPDDLMVLHDRLAFDDLSYFSSIADLQLANLSTAFSSVNEADLASSLHQDRIVRLQATCRTIQSTVSDIKRVVQQVQCRHAGPDAASAANTGPGKSVNNSPSTPMALMGSLSGGCESKAG